MRPTHTLPRRAATAQAVGHRRPRARALPSSSLPSASPLLPVSLGASVSERRATSERATPLIITKPTTLVVLRLAGKNRPGEGATAPPPGCHLPRHFRALAQRAARCAAQHDHPRTLRFWHPLTHLVVWSKYTPLSFSAYTPLFPQNHFYNSYRNFQWSLICTKLPQGSKEIRTKAPRAIRSLPHCARSCSAMAHLRAHRQRAARPIAKPLEGLKISAKLKTTKFQASGF